VGDGNGRLLVAASLAELVVLALEVAAAGVK